MISTTLDNRVLTISFDRADKKNAITNEMYSAAEQALLESADNKDVRVVLFKGEGGNFTSGNDMAAFMSMSTLAEPPVLKFLLALARYPKPVVAAVSGLAIGIGTTMLAHCDYVVAADNVRFKMPFVDLGLCPEGGSSLLFPRFMGNALASELLILGDFFDAQKALHVGLVNNVATVENTLEQAVKVAETLAAKPPAAVRNAKAMLKQDYVNELDKVVTDEIKQLCAMVQGDECKEALAAFAQKRAPDFSKF
jgi:enoyl-CoA hydratase/carnithine racemase